jgi:hypothetical protein
LTVSDITSPIKAFPRYSNLRRPLPYPWSRPILEWNEMVEYKGKLVRRFTKIEDLDIGKKIEDPEIRKKTVDN